jgi:hypothetical protein
MNSDFKRGKSGKEISHVTVRRNYIAIKRKTVETYKHHKEFHVKVATT